MFFSRNSFLILAVLSCTQVVTAVADETCAQSNIYRESLSDSGLLTKGKSKRAKQHLTTRSGTPFASLLRNSTPTQTNHPKKEWTVLIYIHACNNLESFAHKNLREMMKVGSNSRLNILVELHKSGDKSWRYRVDRGNCVLEEVVPRTGQARIGEELFDTVSWAVKTYPSEKLAVIFWNHGIGIKDPMWSVIEPCYMKNGLWRGADVNTAKHPVQKPKSSEAKDPEQNLEATSRATRNKVADDRGILFDDERRTYMTNPELRETLKRISTELLNGKKIDVVGMDACLMAMLEVPYQFKEYARYFVASEEFEFAQGWAYGPLMQIVSQGNVSPQAFCHAVVDTFDAYYRPKTNYFTQSSINVEHIDTLKRNVDDISLLLEACLHQDRNNSHRLITQARSQCLSFSMPEYIDLHSFYTELERLVNQALFYPDSMTGSTSAPHVKREILLALKEKLEAGRRIITEYVVTRNTAGKYLNRARGLSIYFPQKVIDGSYPKTEFAKQSRWLAFLINYLS